ncbi:argininosuccinate lyase [Helicobacter kayseriensis]|uniref:argininosuccinate lyase n=1 Tax=Helicobacter kayseriensis TaxID=2905877 RepID=UPI001E2E3C48|nr:argininosuccinate lyase [Helicobacter kayseriensis]MCE3046621.1 argininosuccinate lyase [Helicobacter kayseriensis]MCE3048077.1 argininosuccinate lyase [Helicobacter kayseriensis]
MAKLWAGRFSQDSSQLLDEFNASIFFDQKLWRQDIQGSKAHSEMLYEIGILSLEEKNQIHQGLDAIAQEIAEGKFKFKLSDEDIHMAIEGALIERIGEAGKKLHTARSRNDQVAVDFRMFVLQSNQAVIQKLCALIDTLLKIASNHTDTLMPGMTHLQHAQPINFAFHLVAWCCAFKRDVERLQASYQRNNFSPLGSGALAGVPYATNRESVAQKLGFFSPTLNAMDSVSDRDFALDMLYEIAMIMMHISRVAEELVLWSSYEFGFVSFSDEFSTGSSIMPQKKNPDVAELLRGKSGRAYGNLIGLLTVMKGLPLAYNKDTQEDKEGVFDSIQTALTCLEILNASLQDLKIHTDRMQKMVLVGHISATDLADFLVKECGIPFREAHHITGEVVAFAEKEGKDISQLKEEEILSIDHRIKRGVLKALDLKSSMNARDSLGGTSTHQTLHQIYTLQEWLKNMENTHG